ncbi:Uma2 family endonuclease [Longimicrobium sp.]|uniref:Uma2 family endonuclease n=1 Tax=Longimicrobium sp. TaxID=2029185 RepID=UPI002B90977E|nr:Uma2 family endonuclease [Longimicrobium sp.]HSU14413.1 Uma2 family endonuclease [Longimicrobium sp.]
MSTQPAARRWTYAEFARLPSDGNRYEVIGGELYVSPSPRPLHQEIVARLGDVIRPFVAEHQLGRAVPGPIDVLFAEGDYMAPDFVFVCQGRVSCFTRRGLEGPPDLVVEIVSPETGRRDRGLKRDRYAHFGVAEYWVIDPEKKRIEIHRATDDPGRKTEIATGDLIWQPVPGGPVLTLNVPDLLREW